jgi:predicted MFS family arabinose efflux permease
MNAERRAAAWLLAMLGAATGISMFHRSALGVVAPDLSRDLALTPEALGAANFAFFIAFVITQVPIGIAFDRVGPRRVVAALSVLAVVGGLGQALARDAAELAVARFVLGLGCSASFMAAVVLSARWYSGPGLTSAIARAFALSQLGIVAAGTPLAFASLAFGWRGALAIAAGVTAVMAVLWWRHVQDDPPGRAPPPRPKEGIAQALRGQLEVWRTKGLWPILSMHLFAYPAMATVLGLWAGPYLADVHGLDAAGRGWVLLAMGVALPAGQLSVGRIERWLNTRKWLAVGGGVLSIAMLAGLALVPGASLALAAALLVGLCLVTCYPVVVVAHGRSLFPDHLVGRGATTVNLAQVVGLALLPAVLGVVVGAFPEVGGVRPEAAYRAAFGVLALGLGLGLAGYLFSKDAPPRA